MDSHRGAGRDPKKSKPIKSCPCLSPPHVECTFARVMGKKYHLRDGQKGPLDAVWRCEQMLNVLVRQVDIRAEWDSREGRKWMVSGRSARDGDQGRAGRVVWEHVHVNDNDEHGSEHIKLV